VSETAPPASQQPEPQTFTRLDVGILIVLVSMAIAGVLGLIAVLAADTDLSALSIGLGVLWVVVLAALRFSALAASRVERPVDG